MKLSLYWLINTRSLPIPMIKALLKLLLVLTFYVWGSLSASAQPILGSNHPELTWHEIETDHFILIYHDGLDSIVRASTPVIEDAYRVVTTNLQTTLHKKLKVYFSDNDIIRNAFAFDNDYIFIWMRGILDDLPYTIRASGTSKWIRSVFTHEFTHIVIAQATRDWTNILFPAQQVPRWFNEGMARYMEPDGWTPDLDMALRVSAVSGNLNFGLDEFLGGTLVYEGGQSVVRYIAAKYGNKALVDIIQNRDGGTYDFSDAVKEATGQTISEIFDDWLKTMNVYYNTQYGQKEEPVDFGRKISSGLSIISSARLQPQGHTIAVTGTRAFGAPGGIYLVDPDKGGASLVTNEEGIASYLTWNPSGEELAYSKLRFGDNDNLIYDIYRLNVNTHETHRVTTDGRFEQPDWSPDGKWFAAVRAIEGGSDIYRVNAETGEYENITKFNDPEVQVYWPRWSHDGSKIAFSIFRKNGMRDLAILDVAQSKINYLTSDSLNDRYTVWSPNDASISFTSYRNQVPNIFRIDGMTIGELSQATDVAGALFGWDWSAQKDSILATSFDSRDKVQLYWIPARRVVQSKLPVPLHKKYTEWKTVHWPLVTRTPDSLTAVNVEDQGAYNSLAHIKFIATLPVLGSDLSRSGEKGLRYGLLTGLRDPMGKHTIFAFADYGDASNRFSYDVQYINAQLRPNILFNAADLIQFSGVVAGKTYFERRQDYSLGILYPITAPNSLTTVHTFSLGGSYKKVLPWNASAFDSTETTRKPIEAQLNTLLAGYGFHTRDLELALNYTHVDKAFGSDLTFSKYRFNGAIQMPLNEGRSLFFALVGKAIAQFGDELPQEVIGFTPFDYFQGGFSVLNTQSSDRLRGIRRYYFGNRLAIASAEFRQPDNLFSRFVPFLQQFDPTLVEFFDIGSTWYGSVPSNNPNVTVTDLFKTKWLKTAGIELRSQLTPGSWFGGGVGWELVKGSKPDWYFRVNITL